MEDITRTIEALLFFKGEPVSIPWLSKTLNVSESDIEAGVSSLTSRLTGGIVLVRTGNDISLRTAPSESEQILELKKDELSRDIGKAGLETLSIIIYRGPVTRAEVDYIRGVNSTFIIRNLLIRGLVEKVPNQKDARSFLYQPTLELLSFLGVTKLSELPEYEDVREEIAQFEIHQKEEHADTK
jgi:segregation and condensation protein B